MPVRIVRTAAPVPIGSERVTIDATAGGVALTPTAGAHFAGARLETAQIRFSVVDGSAPTASTGMLLEVGETCLLDSPDEIANFRGIRTGGTSGVLEITYYK